VVWVLRAALVATGDVSDGSGDDGVNDGDDDEGNGDDDDDDADNVHSRCLRGALPPVDLRAVCLVRAIVMCLWGCVWENGGWKWLSCIG
jgi:hypothetical protein